MSRSHVPSSSSCPPHGPAVGGPPRAPRRRGHRRARSRSARRTPPRRAPARRPARAARPRADAGGAHRRRRDREGVGRLPLDGGRPGRVHRARPRPGGRGLPRHPARPARRAGRAGGRGARPGAARAARRRAYATRPPRRQQRSASGSSTSSSRTSCCRATCGGVRRARRRPPPRAGAARGGARRDRGPAGRWPTARSCSTTTRRSRSCGWSRRCRPARASSWCSRGVRSVARGHSTGSVAAPRHPDEIWVQAPPPLRAHGGTTSAYGRTMSERPARPVRRAPRGVGLPGRGRARVRRGPPAGARRRAGRATRPSATPWTPTASTPRPRGRRGLAGGRGAGPRD